MTVEVDTMTVEVNWMAAHDGGPTEVNGKDRQFREPLFCEGADFDMRSSFHTMETNVQQALI